MTYWRDQATKRLRDVLLQHADTERAEKAVMHLLKAIDHYRQGKPIVDQDGRREALTLAGARTKIERLRALAASGDMEAVMAGIRDPEVLPHVARARGGPIGSVTPQTVGRLLREAEASLAVQARRGRPDDYHRDVLAHDVALVVRDVLSAEINVGKGRGAGTYYKVLGATFETAGILVSDALPWAEAGRAMLEDQSIPHNLLK